MEHREQFSGSLEPEGDYELLTFDDLDLSGQEATSSRFLDCALTRCTLDDVRLVDAHLIETTITEARGVTLEVADATWRDVTLTGCRLGVVRAHGGRLTRVTIRGGKIDYLNLRDARVDDLRLVDTTIGDLDLVGAQATRLLVESSRIDRLDVTRARLTAADIRGADLRAIDGLAGLAGTTISTDQLLALAPLLAAHLRIAVV